MTLHGFINEAKRALQRLSEIELCHEEIDEDEDFDGNWIVDRYTVCDGTIRDLYAEDIETLEAALDMLESRCSNT
jgi:hypothetical protein